MPSTPPPIYMTACDLSDSIGPSVNEREFAFELNRQVPDTRFVIPQPRYASVELGIPSDCFFVPARQGSGGIAQIINQRALFRAVAHLLNADEGRLVIVRLPPVPWAIDRLQRQFPRAKFVFKTVGDTEFLRRIPGLRGRLAAPLAAAQSALTGRVLRRAAAIDVCTPELKRLIIRAYDLDPETIAIVPNATNTERFSPIDPTTAKQQLGFQPHDRIIGYSGGHPATRGGQEILAAVKLLKQDFPHAKAVIIGGDEERLLSEADRLGLTDDVLIPGRVPYDNVPDYLAAMDVAVAMDHADRAAIVGNSYQKVRQYISMGLPVVTLPHGDRALDNPDLISLIDAQDPAQLARAARVILDRSPDQSLSARNRARAFAESNLSVTTTVRQRLALWSDRVPHLPLQTHGSA